MCAFPDVPCRLPAWKIPAPIAGRCKTAFYGSVTRFDVETRLLAGGSPLQIRLGFCRCVTVSRAGPNCLMRQAAMPFCEEKSTLECKNVHCNERKACRHQAASVLHACQADRRNTTAIAPDRSSTRLRGGQTPFSVLPQATRRAVNQPFSYQVFTEESRRILSRTRVRMSRCMKNTHAGKDACPHQ